MSYTLNLLLLNLTWVQRKFVKAYFPDFHIWKTVFNLWSKFINGPRPRLSNQILPSVSGGGGAQELRYSSQPDPPPLILDILPKEGGVGKSLGRLILKSEVIFRPKFWDFQN